MNKKPPRTYLTTMEETGLRMQKIVGTRAGMLLLSEDAAENRRLAQRLREFDWAPWDDMANAMLSLARRIERRMYPAVIGIDRDGYMMDGKGNLFRTVESQQAAKEFYEKAG